MDEGMGQLINRTWFGFVGDGDTLEFQQDTWSTRLLTLCPIRHHCGTSISSRPGPGLTSLLNLARRMVS